MNGKVRFVDITSRDLLTLAIPSWVGRGVDWGWRVEMEGGVEGNGQHQVSNVSSKWTKLLR